MKKLLTILLSVLVVLSLAACTNNNGGSETPADTGKTTVRFASWDSAEDIDSQQAIVDAYNASQDKYEVVLEAYGDDYDTKITAGMMADDAPDVMYMWDYATYYQGLLPLDDLIKNDSAWSSDFFEALWDYNSIDGTVYGVPVGFSTQALYYNIDVFNEAGVELPTDTWTWDDLYNAAKTIHEKTGKYGFTFMIDPDPYDVEMYLWSAGTAFCSPEGAIEGYTNSQEAIDVWTFFQNMEKEGIALATEGSGREELQNGESAMFVYGTWSIDSLKNAGTNFGVAKIPSWPGKGNSVSILSNSGLGIAASSKNVEGAWDFIKYWCGPEGNEARIDYEFPTLKSVTDKYDFENDEIKGVFYKMLEQSEGYTSASFILDNWGEFAYDGLSVGFQQMFNPTEMADVAETLNGIVETYK